MLEAYKLIVLRNKTENCMIYNHSFKEKVLVKVQHLFGSSNNRTNINTTMAGEGVIIEITIIRIQIQQIPFKRSR